VRQHAEGLFVIAAVLVTKGLVSHFFIINPYAEFAMDGFLHFVAYCSAKKSTRVMKARICRAFVIYSLPAATNLS
jgi:hypothetical protein